MGVELLNCDCMDYLRDCEDNAFDLAIVDPDYGIERFSKGPSRIDKDYYATSLEFGGKPSREYFNELFRVSKAQIIWGANNFSLPETEYFCIWDKQQTVDNFASAEYAWVSPSMKTPAKVFRYGIHQHNSDHIGGYKIHPTQKPVKLYEWLLQNYAKEGDRILDTHGGSMSSAIACHYAGLDMVLCEIDKDYFEAGKERFEKETSQIALF